jgi:hypothetical protein
MRKEYIEFRDTTTNKSITREGIKIGDYLAVTREGYVFKVHTGKRLFDPKFNDVGIAVDFIQFLDSLYGKYMILWERWEHMDIFAIARYSVPNGKRLLRIIQQLRSADVITKEMIQGLIKKEMR